MEGRVAEAEGGSRGWQRVAEAVVGRLVLVCVGRSTSVDSRTPLGIILFHRFLL